MLNVILKRFSASCPFHSACLPSPTIRTLNLTSRLDPYFPDFLYFTIISQKEEQVSVWTKSFILNGKLKSPCFISLYSPTGQDSLTWKSSINESMPFHDKAFQGVVSWSQQGIILFHQMVVSSPFLFSNRNRQAVRLPKATFSRNTTSDGSTHQSDRKVV